MYYVGWVGCPHCDFRSRVCIEVDDQVAAEQCVTVRCPNDNSQHRFSLAGMQRVADCPEGLRPSKLASFEQVRQPSISQPWINAVPRPWLGLVIAGLGAV